MDAKDRRAIRKVGDRLDRTERRVRALASTRQISRSTIPVDGEDVPVPEAIAGAVIQSGAALEAAAGAVTATVVEYAPGDESTPPSSGWSTIAPTRAPGVFVWMRTIVTYGDESTSATTPVLVTGNDGAVGATGSTGATGATGAAGAAGVSVSTVQVYYRTTAAAAAAPAIPTTTTPPAPWALTEPAYVADTALWATTRVVYSNGTFSYTPVSKVSAYTAAAAAKAAADAAATAAATADGKAVAAQTTASNAASAASTAAAAAADAAGIAGGKADVLIQAAAPAPAFRKATTLWIDTTGGLNTPKRWVSGTTWAAVTDKAATDAAAAAVAAAGDAADAQASASAAGVLAADAQAAALSAQADAGAALDAGTAAQDTADAAAADAAAAQAAADLARDEGAATAAELAALAVQVAEAKQVYDWGDDEAVISRPPSPFSMALTHDEMQFRENGVARAWLNAGQFHAPQMVAGQIVVAGHVIEAHAAGGTVFRNLI